MSWRTVIISSQAKLDYKMGLMVVRGYATQKIVLDEVAVLVIENPSVSITGCLLEALVEKKIKVIFCDSKRNPSSELVPHHGSHDSSAKIRTQVQWKPDIKANLWREIVGDKIRKQSEFLFELGEKSAAELIASYISQIEPGDTTNREGHAAKVYFNALFGMDFTRSADNATNAALNYGYAMLLSCFNREISANGYLTQLGIFHDNMFNHFNLGSDLMEPFRIIVDRTVQLEKFTKFETEDKHKMWYVLEERVRIDNSIHSLRNAIKIYTRSVFDALNDMDTSKVKFYEII